MNHSVMAAVPLVSHPDTFDALHGGDLAKARRVLDAAIQKKQKDAELNYYLGCIDLIQSDAVADAADRKAMQARGWQRVEMASGKFCPANSLLAHAYLVGRWGKRRNHELYVKQS
jgi:hypothetical protein